MTITEPEPEPAELLLERVRRLTADRAAAEDAWRSTIKDAIRAGVRVADIAAAARISAARVYQIRDDRR